MRTTKKKAAASKSARTTAQEGTSRKPDHNGNSAAAQRERLLAALRTAPVTTLQARSSTHLDCMHPGARIMELRKLGHRIQTIWTTDFTPAGKPHRVALYVLNPGGAT